MEFVLFLLSEQLTDAQLQGFHQRVCLNLENKISQNVKSNLSKITMLI